jgi:hypothetical protein
MLMISPASSHTATRRVREAPCDDNSFATLFNDATFKHRRELQQCWTRDRCVWRARSVFWEAKRKMFFFWFWRGVCRCRSLTVGLDPFERMPARNICQCNAIVHLIDDNRDECIVLRHEKQKLAACDREKKNPKNAKQMFCKRTRHTASTIA